MSNKRTEKVMPTEVKYLSLINAAAAVLERSREPLNCIKLVELAKAKNLWKPGEGKTPEQTLYSAIMREIANKGEAAHFKKTDFRGYFTWNESAH